ncbi:LysR family transcriptional regulator [Marinobacterium sediminicola]|uniref:DNA-binding transcriptional regulator, LysR family n=1 Tax=Marinobacterium sediminicola TaxID=518898 RepID=A0ABY1RYK6_9GAMM|nr:LysR family transcriptional regulator [Marinobacterium sediminicola]ULG68081.1 LysR family transcriptional regulator [Marinobacterium sediminicola]SMR73407.1 DNA-binding transcriptional regulator, LysR family [Marinobacterium sediminicola]
MRDADLSLPEVRAFNAVVSAGNFTRAAQQLGVSQPAVTAQMRKLEARFKGPLLERVSHGVRLTELGQRLYRITAQFAELDHNVRALIKPGSASSLEEIRLATASPLVFMPLIARFVREYPEVSLKLHTATTDECFKVLANREVDIGLFPMHWDDRQLSRLAYRDHHLVAILPSTHPLAGLSRLSLHQLQDESLIFSRRYSYTQQLLDRLIQQEGLALKSSIWIDSRTDICEAVAHGLGVGFAFKGDIPAQGEYAVVPIAEAAEAITEHVVWLKSRSDLPEVRCFVDLALRVLGESQASCLR